LHAALLQGLFCSLIGLALTSFLSSLTPHGFNDHWALFEYEKMAIYADFFTKNLTKDE